MGFQALDVLLEQLVLGAVSGPVQVTARRARLVRPQDKPLVFFPQVPGTVGLTQDGHFRQSLLIPGNQVGMGFRYDVLVFDRHHRDFQADHGAGAAGIVTGGGNDVLTGDITPGGLHPPFAGRGALNAFHHGIAVNNRTPSPGALCQGLGQVGRLDIAVFGMKQRADQPVRIAQRPEITHLFRGKEFGMDANGAGRGRVLVILVHTVPVHGQAQVADLLEAHLLPGFLFQLLVEVYRVFMNLANAVTHVEQGQQTGRMPGGTGGQFRFFHQHYIVTPAFSGQVIKGTDTDNTAADDHNPCV